jgi:hypothetical protein
MDVSLAASNACCIRTSCSAASVAPARADHSHCLAPSPLPPPVDAALARTSVTPVDGEAAVASETAAGAAGSSAETAQTSAHRPTQTRASSANAAAHLYPSQSKKEVGRGRGEGRGGKGRVRGAEGRPRTWPGWLGALVAMRYHTSSCALPHSLRARAADPVNPRSVCRDAHRNAPH